MKQKFFSSLAFLLGLLLFSAIVCLAIAQTSWFQKTLTETVIAEAKKQHIDLEIQGVEATIPFKWKVEEFHLQFAKTNINIKGLNIRVSPFSLLKKKLTLRFFSAEQIYIEYEPSHSSSKLPEINAQLVHAIQKIPNQSFIIPLNFRAKKIECEKITLKNKLSDKTITFSASGSIRIEDLGKEFLLDLLLEQESGANYMEIVALSSQKDKAFEATVQTKIKNEKDLSVFLNIPSIPSGDMTFKTRKENKNLLHLELYAETQSLNLKKESCFDHPICVSFVGDLTLNPNDTDLILAKECKIEGKDFSLSGPFTISSEFNPVFADVSVSLKESSPIHCLIPFQGGLEGKASIDRSSFKICLHSESLTIKELTYEPVDLEILGEKKQNIWVGTSKALLKNPFLPWQQSLQFRLGEDVLLLDDISLTFGSMKIGGNGSYKFFSHCYEGSFFVMAEELRPFRHLFSGSELDGKLGGSFTIEGNLQDLQVDLSCLLKNIRYQNNLIDTAQIDAHLCNLGTSPVGSLSCEAKNIFVKDLVLETFSFHTDQEKENIQEFALSLEGDWKQQISLHMQGSWKKEESLWKVDLRSCNGSFLSETFSLKTPFSIESTTDELVLESSSWKIGDGELSSEFSLGQDWINFQAEGSHLPLGILGVLYPKMAFQGTASFQSIISGPQDDIKGHFFGTLEKADFSQNKAKGSLQIHFNPNGAQVYGHLYATNEQFLDLTATVPLKYEMSPFCCSLEQNRPITAELTMQGALEEIFDFINTASHKTTGWLTTHLFLSGTLDHPSLLGSLRCEQGSYENYYSGTKLKNIEAIVSTSSNTVHLSSFTGSDGEKGSLSAMGSLFLSPSQNFPFQIKTQISQIHALQTDAIDTSLSGFLEIEGNKLSSKAHGNLIVEHATFKIFDNLPYEIPTLPVTFINKPISLQTPILNNQLHPFYLDVQLSAKDTVVVKGRGLESTWEGEVQIVGTAANPAGRGSLRLKQGEFVFSGKTFNLKQGEISFSDKPSPGAYLKLNGELSLPSAIILAQMQGPLTSPQLTFQSIPSLPTSSILALVLFDKDISEISALQALQLAQTIVSLSGNGTPGVIEAIRKKIGVDRLNIVGKDGTDEISVQIGWYLSHGITISLSQSATSSDVTVEVDLKNGFIFQAETQNQEEGKFSLKWNKNY